VNRTVRLFALVAAGLALLIAVELFTPSGAPVEAAAPQAAPPAETDAAPQAGSGSAEFADAILARPLFKPDRHPYADGRAPISAPPPDLPRLTGILMSSDVRHAIFEPAGANKPIVVVEGDNVGGWRVQEIATDSVTLVGPEGTTRLEPKFSATQAAATPADTAPAPTPAPDAALPRVARHPPVPFGTHKQRNGGLQPPARKH
jgi:hypothetical protein